jgi:hypothetical protein
MVLPQIVQIGGEAPAQGDEVKIGQDALRKIAP